MSLDDKSQEYIESLKDMVFNLSDKKSYDDVYLENIINYFEQLQNARGYVTQVLHVTGRLSDSAEQTSQSSSVL